MKCALRAFARLPVCSGACSLGRSSGRRNPFEVLARLVLSFPTRLPTEILPTSAREPPPKSYIFSGDSLWEARNHCWIFVDMRMWKLTETFAGISWCSNAYVWNDWDSWVASNGRRFANEWGALEIATKAADIGQPTDFSGSYASAASTGPDSFAGHPWIFGLSFSIVSTWIALTKALSENACWNMQKTNLILSYSTDLRTQEFQFVSEIRKSKFICKFDDVASPKFWQIW